MVYTGVNAIALKVWTSKFYLTIKKKLKEKTQSLLYCKIAKKKIVRTLCVFKAMNIKIEHKHVIFEGNFFFLKCKLQFLNLIETNFNLITLLLFN